MPIIGKHGRAIFQSLEIAEAAIFGGMGFIADTHVHIYPHFDIAEALHGAIARLGELAPELPRAICLTERSGCHFFRDVFSAAIKLPPPFSVLSAGENAFMAIDNAGEKLFVIAGRQIATSERLEVHCLGCDADIPDGLPLRDAIEHVFVAGGMAVVPWGVGKWTGRRGKLVRDVIAGDNNLLAGDSSLRPWCWPEPVFRAAKLRVLCGSDPLPAPAEENQIARYATIFDAPFDENEPASSLHPALRSGNFHRAGKRCGVREVLRRLRAMKKAAQ